MKIKDQLILEAETRIYELLKTCPDEDKSLYYHQLERIEQIRSINKEPVR